MNPARSAGPAIAAAEVGDLWVYVAAPLLGASLGALAYQLLRGEPTVPGELAAEGPGNKTAVSASSRRLERG
jgi:hypothetical protein